MSVWRGEGQILGRLALEKLAERAGQELREGDGATLMGFGGAEDDLAADLGGGLDDLEAAPVQVDSSDAQRGRLAPAQAGVGEDVDQRAVGPSSGGEVGDLLMAEEVAWSGVPCGFVYAWLSLASGPGERPSGRARVAGGDAWAQPPLNGQSTRRPGAAVEWRVVFVQADQGPHDLTGAPRVPGTGLALVNGFTLVGGELVLLFAATDFLEPSAESHLSQARADGRARARLPNLDLSASSGPRTLVITVDDNGHRNFWDLSLTKD